MQHGPKRDKHLHHGFRYRFHRQYARLSRRVRRDIHLLDQVNARLWLHPGVLHYLPMDYARNALVGFDFSRNVQAAAEFRGLSTFSDRKHLAADSHNRATSEGVPMFNSALACQQTTHREGKPITRRGLYTDKTVQIVNFGHKDCSI